MKNFKALLLASLILLSATSRASSSTEILWVIDNSESMREHQMELQRSSAKLFGFLAAQSTLNWRMAMVTTDLTYAGLGFVADEVMSSSEPHTAERFNSFVGKVGTDGSGDEMPFTPLLNALKTYPTFFQPGQNIDVVFVTDAPGSEDPVSVAELKAALVAAAGSGYLRFHGLLAADDLKCQSEGWDYEGSRYQELIESTGGIAMPLCSFTLDAAMQALAERIR